MGVRVLIYCCKLFIGSILAYKNLSAGLTTAHFFRYRTDRREKKKMPGGSDDCTAVVLTNSTVPDAEMEATILAQANKSVAARTRRERAPY